jgi:hypothetical protein
MHRHHDLVGGVWLKSAYSMSLLANLKGRLWKQGQFDLFSKKRVGPCEAQNPPKQTALNKDS